MTAIEPEELLIVARTLCEHPGPDLEGRWPRAAAVITRAALEGALDEYWQQREPGIAAVLGGRAKMLCLPTYLADDELAHQAYETWASLSNACHRHAYELDPTADEIERWITNVELLRVRLSGQEP
jgi:hypothetical protein